MEEKGLFDQIGKAYRGFSSVGDLHLQKHRLLHLRTRARFLLRLTSSDQRARLESLCKRCADEILLVGWCRAIHAAPQKAFEEWYDSLVLNHLLLLAARSRMEKAWELIRERYRRPLFHWLFQSQIEHSSGLHSRDQAQEWAEEVFQKGWINLSQFNPYKSSLYTWLTAIAKNLAFSKPAKMDQQTTLRFESMEEENEDFDGIDRVASLEIPEKTPEQRAEEEAVGSFFLKVVFERVGYPWQVIAFFFQKLVYPPQEIVEHLAGCTLFLLTEKLFHEFAQTSLRPRSQIEGYQKAFEQRLQHPLKDSLNPKDNATRRHMAPSMDMIVGDIPLECFLGSHPEKQVSEWSGKVMVRLRATAREEGINTSDPF